jgi:hypothetical protein
MWKGNNALVRFFVTTDNDSGGLSFELCVEKRATMKALCHFNII